MDGSLYWSQVPKCCACTGDAKGCWTFWDLALNIKQNDWIGSKTKCCPKSQGGLPGKDFGTIHDKVTKCFSRFGWFSNLKMNWFQTPMCTPRKLTFNMAPENTPLETTNSLGYMLVSGVAMVRNKWEFQPHLFVDAFPMTLHQRQERHTTWHHIIYKFKNMVYQHGTAYEFSK